MHKSETFWVIAVIISICLIGYVKYKQSIKQDTVIEKVIINEDEVLQEYKYTIKTGSDGTKFIDIKDNHFKITSYKTSDDNIKYTLHDADWNNTTLYTWHSAHKSVQSIINKLMNDYYDTKTKQPFKYNN